MSQHLHQHAVKVRASAASLDAAVAKALEGLTDPAGHHAGLSFHAFEVLHVGGRFDPTGWAVVDVTVEAFGTHKG